MERDDDADDEENKDEGDDEDLEEVNNNEIALDRDDLIEEDEQSKNPDEPSEKAGED